HPAPRLPGLVCDRATRVADPKLSDGGARFAFHLNPPTGSANALVEGLANGTPIATPWSGTLFPGSTPTEITWDRRDADGLRCATGSYTLRLSAPGFATVERPLELVRLGITEVQAQDSPGNDDEFQMVYFMKGLAYAYYATPEIHEYLDVAPAGE